MQTYPTLCILKKDWVSHRGKTYPAGTTFTRNKNSPTFSNRPDSPGHWYDFRIPTGLPFPHQGGAFGFLFIPNRIFFLLTEEEKLLRDARNKLKEEHMKYYEHL